MSTIESQLADRINSTGLLGQNGEPKESTQPRTTQRAAPKAAPVEDTTDDTDDLPPEEIEDTDDAGTDASDEAADDGEEIDNPANDTIQELREQLAELRGMIRGKDANATDQAGGAAAPTARTDAKIEKKFAQVRADFLKAQEERGELPGDAAMLALLDQLEADHEAQQTEKLNAQKQHESQTREQQIQAANKVHTTLNGIARGNVELIKAIGIGQHGTLKPAQAQMRQRIMAAAVRALQDANDEVELGHRTQPLTDAQAITVAMRRLKLIKGDAQTPEQQARARAQMVRGGGNAATSKGASKETEQQTEARLAKQIDASAGFLSLGR